MQNKTRAEQIPPHEHSDGEKNMSNTYVDARKRDRWARSGDDDDDDDDD